MDICPCMLNVIYNYIIYVQGMYVLSSCQVHYNKFQFKFNNNIAI